MSRQRLAAGNRRTCGADKTLCQNAGGQCLCDRPAGAAGQRQSNGMHLPTGIDKHVPRVHVTFVQHRHHLCRAEPAACRRLTAAYLPVSRTAAFRVFCLTDAVSRHCAPACCNLHEKKAAEQYRSLTSSYVYG